MFVVAAELAVCTPAKVHELAAIVSEVCLDHARNAVELHVRAAVVGERYLYVSAYRADLQVAVPLDVAYVDVARGNVDVSLAACARVLGATRNGADRELLRPVSVNVHAPRDCVDLQQL